jgi:hypothetical protein
MAMILAVRGRQTQRQSRGHPAEIARRGGDLILDDSHISIEIDRFLRIGELIILYMG